MNIKDQLKLIRKQIIQLKSGNAEQVDKLFFEIKKIETKVSRSELINLAEHWTFTKDVVLVERFLNEFDLDVNEKDYLHETLLFFAVKAESLDTVKFLISLGADINVSSLHGWSPLMYAVLKKNVDILYFLKQKGARNDLNFKNTDQVSTACGVASLKAPSMKKHLNFFDNKENFLEVCDS